MSRFLPLPSPFATLGVFSALTIAITMPTSASAQQGGSSILRTSDSIGKSKDERASKGRPVTVKQPKVDESNLPTSIEAEELTGRPDREMTAEKNVEIVRGQTTITSDKAIFRQEENEVEAIGNVRMERFGDVYIADAAEMNLDTGAGVAYNAEYRLIANKAQGKAERVDMKSDETTHIVKGTYSTCEGSDPDWYLKMGSMDADIGRNVGYAHNSVLYFQDVPILSLPVMTFPMSNERKSGFLAPTMGMTSKSGMEIVAPYYFNLAPNYDFTLSPKMISRRGLQIGAAGRYLGQNYTGETKLEVLPDDQERNNETRYSMSSKHTHTFAPGWTYSWDFNTASDRNYPDDFGTSVAISSQRLLAQNLSLNYVGNIVSGGARVTNYQVLQDVDAPITKPHERMPQVFMRANRIDVAGFDWEMNTDFTRFWLSDSDLRSRSLVPSYDMARGERYIVNPKISYPIQAPGYFIRPKVSMHATQYENLENWSDPVNNQKITSIDRTVPTYSLDSGLIFERESSLFGNAMTQTLEPRLFYVYTPYRDQSNIPRFDTGETTFGFAQIFSENRFAGSDRISDANHLTAAVTTRYIEPGGAERLRFTLGERFYFENQRVGLDGNLSSANDRRSDLLLAVGGRPTRTISFDSMIQYDVDANRTYSANYGIQWKPAPKSVLNAEYRYIRNTLDSTTDVNGNGLEQVTFSAQWPLADRWYGVGQISYSLQDNRTIENLIGVEFNADCWVLRLVAQRYATSSVESNTALFLQLQLNGLAGIGSNPFQALRKTIPGYQPVTDESVQSSFFSNDFGPYSSSF